MVVNKWGTIRSAPHLKKEKYIMIILEKDNNKKIAFTIEDAQKEVNNGYKVIKNKLSNDKIVPTKTKKKKKKK
ncbi:MAG: hypothetical protein Unbinned6747contig1000_4 [Prokaryotic dsDNA virus sp.]|nr:MAG: hypothetical protein Unbinned6747contig1000_4 [Prokaryotic dsDNA virus sp.]|tara:strand:+ start:28971 stop:29189 length:219 start_codon:yes stop_codon:yes gene_type:complete